jgi:hypothetical protein
MEGDLEILVVDMKQDYLMLMCQVVSTANVVSFVCSFRFLIPLCTYDTVFDLFF